MVAWGVRDLIAGSTAAVRWLVAAAAVACLGALTIVSSTQISYWRDTMTLFEHALAVTERNYVTHANLGAELVSLGRNGEAHAHYAEALRLQPVFPKAHLSLGALLIEEGRIDEAMPHLDYAVQNRPDAPAAHLTTGSPSRHRAVPTTPYAITRKRCASILSMRSRGWRSLRSWNGEAARTRPSTSPARGGPRPA